MPSKFFCPKTPKNIVGGHFCVSEMFWYQKILDNRSITILLICFVSHRQKSPWANTSVFQNYSGFQTLWIIWVSRFCRPFLSHSTEKFRRGILAFLKSYGMEKLLDNKVSRFRRLFFPHSAEKFVENPPMIQKN